MNLVVGHTIDGRVYEFPHHCPGYGCAIAEWLARKDERIRYEELETLKAKAS